MRRLRLLWIDAMMRAEEAIKEAIGLAIQLAAAGDDVDRPPTSTSLSDVPFRRDTPPPGSLKALSKRETAYSHVAVTREKVSAHLKKAHAEAMTDAERDEVIDRMRALAANGTIDPADVADFIGGNL